MLDLNAIFLDFDSKISLTKDYKDKIITGRDALRKKIGDKFSEKGRNKPKHCTQGSFAMRTAIMPSEEDEFDLDNGVYLQGYSQNQEEWPTTSTVHSWIKDAVDGHTSTPPQDKNTCVRVIYQDKYHIDLPAYIVCNDDNGNEMAYLAHKSKGWTKSDPKAFTDWFQEHVNDNGQVIRHIVKYLKAWKDFKSIDIKGMAITILVCQNFSITENREDVSLLDTVTNIYDSLSDEFHCYKPVTPTDEDLLGNVSETTKNSILDGFKRLKDQFNKAIYEETNEKKATDRLKKLFGDKFPDGEDANKDIYQRTSSPIKLGGEDSHFA